MKLDLSSPIRPDINSAALQRLLETRLAGHFGEPRGIQVLDQRPCPYASSFRIDELAVRFVGGARLRLVVKDLGPGGMLEAARRVRPGFLYEPRREINAYRWILPHAPVGTAESYGAVVHPSASRYWLLLERVAGRPLWQEGDLAIWAQTARWIARFHRGFSQKFASQVACRADVLTYNAAFYWRWMHRAQRFCADDALQRRALDRIARGYGAVVKRLVGMPRTIIHGEFYPSNILIGRKRGVRICPLDWEMAALGPGLVDLATLSAGWAAPTARAMARAYFAEVEGKDSSVPVRLPKDFSTDLACCQLHMAIRMLGWSNHWVPPARQARNWLVEAQRLSERLAARLSP